MTQPTIAPFCWAIRAPVPVASSFAMPSTVLSNAPDSGTSLPRYSSKAAAIVAATAMASKAVAVRRTRVSLMQTFSRRLAQNRGNANGVGDVKTYRIAAIPGDGIGTEVVSAGVEVLQALA